MNYISAFLLSIVFVLGSISIGVLLINKKMDRMLLMAPPAIVPSCPNLYTPPILHYKEKWT